MKKQRKQYAPEEKVAILRRHLLEKEPISKLCDELGLQPTVFYRWQKEFFENGAAGSVASADSRVVIGWGLSQPCLFETE
jgi:transposase-like protein